MRTTIPQSALVCLVAILWFALPAHSEESSKPKTATVVEAKVTIHLTPEGTDKGLRLFCPGQISASSAQAVDFPIRVMNLLEEEVFLEVTGYDDLRYELRNGVGISSGGNSVVFFPDNANLLKRLHSSSYKDGKPFTCGCAMAFIPAKIDFGKDNSLKDWIGAKAVITVTLSGYYRTNGKAFHKSVDVPVEIVK